MISMTCEEKVQSSEYREILRDYTLTETAVSEGLYDYCRVEVDSNLYIVYYRPVIGMPNDISIFPYYEIPKC